MFLLSPLTIGLLLIAYLVGAIPTALWVGKSLYSLDLREHGSRNAGATNTIRVLGLKAGIPVLLFDIHYTACLSDRWKPGQRCPYSG